MCVAAAKRLGQCAGGLLPFREEEASLFFGHEEAIDTFLGKLRDHNLVTLVGRSGSGKSSVVFAGLIPRLRRGAGGLVWEVVTLVPADRPLASLAASLLPLLEPGLTEVDRFAEVGKLARHLAEGEIRLCDVTSRIAGETARHGTAAAVRRSVISGRSSTPRSCATRRLNPSWPSAMSPNS